MPGIFPTVGVIKSYWVTIVSTVLCEFDRNRGRMLSTTAVVVPLFGGGDARDASSIGQDEWVTCCTGTCC